MKLFLWIVFLLNGSLAFLDQAWNIGNAFMAGIVFVIVIQLHLRKNGEKASVAKKTMG